MTHEMNYLPLVLLHGYPFDHSLWDAVVAELQREPLTIGRILAPDFPGFGEIPVSPAEPSLDVLAADVVRLLDLHSLPRAVVAGMSMGGYVALALAERCPDRVAGLGLISTQAAADSDEMKQGRRGMIRRVQAEGPRVAVEAALLKLFAPAHEQDENLRRFPIEGGQRAGVAGISWALEAMARRPDRHSVVEHFRGPCLVLHGAQDRFIPAAKAREMSMRSAAPWFVELPESGHATPIENPRAVAQALRELVGKASGLAVAATTHARSLPPLTISPTERGL